MTLQPLLDELKRMDPETWDDAAEIANVIRIQSDGSISTDADDVDFILQGLLQRACERRGWIWHHGHGPEMGYVATVNHVNIVKGDSATEVLLAAYIAAVREKEKK